MELSRTEDSSQFYWGFISGFILGWAMNLLLFGLVMRYWFLDDATKRVYSPSSSSVSPKLKATLDRKRELIQSVEKNFKNQNAPLSISDVEVLSKTLYGLSEHSAESTDWLNVVFAQIISKYRNDLLMNNLFTSALNKALNTGTKTSLLGAITLTDISFGQEFPLLKDVIIKHKKDSSSVYAEITVEYNDRITVAFDTSLLIGARGMNFAALPISLALSFVKFVGKITLELEATTADPSIFFSVQPEYDLDFEINSLVGHRSKLKDVPKFASMIVYNLKSVFQTHFVSPQGKRFKLPRIDKLFVGLSSPDTSSSTEANASSSTSAPTANYDASLSRDDGKEIEKSLDSVVTEMKDA
ncbi:ERMES complex subunit mmm1 [Entomophthora muscae]|uniref:ERMES complex subunit mmm1 n=1 Tax=Entomophthora muscae TaxID=34485 RepID=A0ACC2RXE5_9FUNG|nr:ERMES complex subunit mmm1 [Entomophthora muscae]